MYTFDEFVKIFNAYDRYVQKETQTNTQPISTAQMIPTQPLTPPPAVPQTPQAALAPSTSAETNELTALQETIKSLSAAVEKLAIPNPSMNTPEAPNPQTLDDVIAKLF